MPAPALAVQINGGSPVSGDNLNTYEQTCDNVAELRGFVGVTGVQVYIRGTTTANDGGQGPFYWNSTGTAPDDNGVTTIVPTGVGTNGGEWTRVQFSAIGNLVISGNLTVTGSSTLHTVTATSILLNGSPVFDKMNIQTFISSGTYTPATGMVFCKVYMCGGGGGGGGTVGAGSGSACSSGGGGGGGLVGVLLSAIQIGTSQNITIGAGGAGGASGANNGSPGGTTSLGSLISCTGGGGGGASGNTTAVIALPSSPGNGGSPAISTGAGTTLARGGVGGEGIILGSSSGGIGGNGGGSGLFPSSGAIYQPAANTIGFAAPANSGGGGGGSFSTTNSLAGGAGGSGYVLIEEYISG